MANVTINQLPTAVTIDGSADILPIYTASALATQGINRNTLLGITSGPVGLTDSQTLTNKILGNTNTLTVKDTLFTLQDDGDTTKQARFQLSGITTSTTRTFTLPDTTDTLVTLAATQTLTNKTLTSPTINTPTITNATISADTLTGFTTSNNGTIYGIAVSGGTIGTSALANASVTAAKMINGMVLNRQGGTTGDNTWITKGTSNTNTSAKNVFFQAGAVGLSTSGTDITVTFPTAFNQAPLVFVTTITSNSANVTTIANSITTTTFKVRAIGADGSNETASWLAIGQ